MLQFSAVPAGSEDESESTQSRAVATLVKRTKDGTLPIVAGSVTLARALKSNDETGRSVSRLLAGTALVGIGLRQRRHHSAERSETPDENEHHSDMGTSDQRIDSHQGVNPRDIDQEPTTESDADEQSIEFSDEQIDETPQSDGDDRAANDPRIDDDVTEVDLSAASMADEASEAAGPSTVQSQPTQTDAIEPEETPEEDSSQAGSDESGEETEDEHANETTQ